MSYTNQSHSFAIVCDSSCELSPVQCSQMAVTLVSSRIFFKDEEWLDRNVSTSDLKKIVGSDLSKVRISMPGHESFEAVFSELVEQGFPSIVVVTASSLLTGSYEAAARAAHKVSGARIEVIDTKCISAQLTILVTCLARDRARGLSVDQAVEHISNLARELRLFVLMPAEVNPEGAHLFDNARGLRRSLMLLSLKVSGGYILTTLAASGDVIVERRSNDLPYLAGLLARKMSLYSRAKGPLTRVDIYSGDKRLLAVLEKPLDTNEFQSECAYKLKVRPSTAFVMGQTIVGVAFVPQSLVKASELELPFEAERG